VSHLRVIFRVAGAEYSLPAHDVLHMESWTSATRVPGAPPWVRGVVQSRGRMLPVVDLRARFGEPPLEGSPDQRLIAVEHGDRVVALLVDSAREVADVPDEQFHEPPDLVRDESAGFVRGVGRVGGRILFEIDVPRVIGRDVHDGG
jgi:purine-binding chemotaxis protein CheW